MKKFFAICVLFVVSVLTVSATVKKVQYVKIDLQKRSTMVYFSDGSKIGSGNNEAFRGFFNSLRAGDLIDIEVEPSTYDHLVAARKVGYERPEGLTNGVIINDGSYGYGTYGGVYGGAGAAVIATKNVGIGYDPYTGVHVRIGNGENGFGAVNIPVRIKSKKVNSNYTTVNNGGVVTASPATVPNVKSVSVDQLTSLTGKNVVRTSATVSTAKTTTTKTVPARSSRKVKVYEVGTLPSAM